MKLYIAELFRICDGSSRYNVGVFDNLDDAFIAGKAAKHWRGGFVWDYRIQEVILNRFNKKHIEQYKVDYDEHSV